jgi:hypothetical protein
VVGYRRICTCPNDCEKSSGACTAAQRNAPFLVLEDGRACPQHCCAPCPSFKCADLAPGCVPGVQQYDASGCATGEREKCCVVDVDHHPHTRTQNARLCHADLLRVSDYRVSADARGCRLHSLWHKIQRQRLQGLAHQKRMTLSISSAHHRCCVDLWLAWVVINVGILLRNFKKAPFAFPTCKW